MSGDSVLQFGPLGPGTSLIRLRLYGAKADGGELQLSRSILPLSSAGIADGSFFFFVKRQVLSLKPETVNFCPKRPDISHFLEALFVQESAVFVQEFFDPNTIQISVVLPALSSLPCPKPVRRPAARWQGLLAPLMPKGSSLSDSNQLRILSSGWQDPQLLCAITH